MSVSATVSHISRGSFHDGPGVRTVVYLKGCHMRCKWCHNPETQESAPQIMFYKQKCIGCGKCVQVCACHTVADGELHHDPTGCVGCGKCAALCPALALSLCGEEKTAEETLAEILRDRHYFISSGGGVTFSGGECMLQVDFLAEILRLCKENGIHTAVDTAGDVPWEAFEKVIPYTDLFLYDVKAVTESLHKEGTGVSNVRILTNLARLSDETAAEIIVRVPVIGGYNDTDAEMTKIAAVLRSLRIKCVELLPYHAMGEHKYEAIGREGKTFTVPDAARMEVLRAHFH